MQNQSHKAAQMINIRELQKRDKCLQRERGYEFRTEIKTPDKNYYRYRIMQI
jgi:hypothetical protein